MPPQEKIPSTAEQFPNQIGNYCNDINGRMNLPKLHTRVRFPSPAPSSWDFSNLRRNRLVSPDDTWKCKSMRPWPLLFSISRGAPDGTAHARFHVRIAARPLQLVTGARGEHLTEAIALAPPERSFAVTKCLPQFLPCAYFPCEADIR